MDDKTILAAVLLDENTKISFIEVCKRCEVSEDVLLEMIEYGLFNTPVLQSNKLHIDQKALVRIQSARRLQQDLDINIPGVVLVLELLDELTQIQNELHILEHHVKVKPL